MSGSTVVAIACAIYSQSPIHPGTAFDSSTGKPPAGAIPDSSPRIGGKGTPPGKSAAKPLPPGSVGNPLCGPLGVRFLGWGPNLGPLHISGTVVLGPGQTLEIDAGTTVLASPDAVCADSAHAGEGTGLLVTGGSLLVRGTPGHPVVFRPSIPGKDFGWGGIRVEQAVEGAVDLAWLEVHRATTGVSFVAGAGEMRHGAVVDCGIGIAVLSGAAPRILHCVVDRSLLADVVSERSAPLFRSCLFLDGHGDGLRFQGTGIARVETSCFWGHLGAQVVRGPEGLGSWKSDTLPDRFGNWRRDPGLRGSALDRAATETRRIEVAAAPWWKHQRMPEPPWGSGPWALSAFSPLLGAGERGLCRIPSGMRCDIGLWSGP